MILKKFNPVTPSLRTYQRIYEKDLWKGRPVKSLTLGLKKSGGRNNLGRLTSYRQGGGHKRLYRFIDFNRNQISEAVVLRMEYDPNRSSYISLIEDVSTKQLTYILAPMDIKVGQKVYSGDGVDISSGNSLPLSSIPIGTIIHNIEINPGQGGKLCRSAGTFALLLQKNEEGYGMVRLSSGEQRLINLNCWATIGKVSNEDHKNTQTGKAGRSRWLGRRPSVRGVAMNPVDHPHGGGQGKTSGGRPSVTPWGIPTKGYVTRKNKTTNKYIIKRRNK